MVVLYQRLQNIATPLRQNNYTFVTLFLFKKFKIFTKDIKYTFCLLRYIGLFPHPFSTTFQCCYNFACIMELHFFSGCDKITKKLKGA